LLGPESGPLPVKVTEFTATLQKNNTVLLQWQTASEQNLQGFSIERGTATSDFTAIGYAVAKGNTNTVTNYVSTDQQPIPGLNFYRLKMMNSNGEFSYSKIVSADIKNELFSIRLSPNPAKNILFVKITALIESATLQIIDANGAALKEALVPAGNTAAVSFDINNLSTGIYNLRIFTKTRMEVVRFIKE
jgi:hypothetical protein